MLKQTKNTQPKFKKINEFKEADSKFLRGEKSECIKASAEVFKKNFKKLGMVKAVKTIDLVSAAYPTSFAYAGAAIGLNPYVNINNRLIIVQFLDFNDNLKTFLWEPTIKEGSARAPFYKQLIKKYGEFLSYKILTKEFHTLEQALDKVGIKPEQVDYVSFDHLHVQDLRTLMGTNKPLVNETEPRKPFFPNAKFIFQKKEFDTLRSPHPMQWAWYVTDSSEDLNEDNMVLIEGDILLGKGIALLSTPGHTDGNHSLCINTPEGIWVSSENGVSMDSYFPEYSKIPGLKSYSRFYKREVILNSNTLEDSIDQYDSMLKEKYVADIYTKDPRFRNILPSSEVGNYLRQWPVIPIIQMKGINYGEIQNESS